MKENKIKINLEEVVGEVTLEELEKHLRDVFFARPESYFEGKRVPMKTEVSVYVNDDNISVKITNGFHSMFTGIGGLKYFMESGDFDVFKVNEQEISKEEATLFVDYHTRPMTLEELKERVEKLNEKKLYDVGKR